LVPSGIWQKSEILIQSHDLHCYYLSQYFLDLAWIDVEMESPATADCIHFVLGKVAFFPCSGWLSDMERDVVFYFWRVEAGKDVEGEL
jgi:hypothetical protein